MRVTIGMPSDVVTVLEASQVAQARRTALRSSRSLGLDADAHGRAALVATELATNLVKHARGGELIVTSRQDDLVRAVDLLAVDCGPGISNWADCLRDGFSTTGSPGTGLGAIRRAADAFDVFSIPSRGTGVFARVAERSRTTSRRDALSVAAVSVPYPGETECGDAWSLQARPDGLRVLLVDGLGHGAQAAEAARVAVDVFAAHQHDPSELVMTRMHEGSRHTRGAAAAIADVDQRGGVVTFCGVGNISGAISTGEHERHMVSQNGTLGLEARRIQTYSYPWTPGGVLVLHSDGLGTHWKLTDYPGLLFRHPALIAGSLYRDFRRRRDDATVVVVGLPAPGTFSERTLQ